MILLDANYILRYFLQDNESMFKEAKEVISKEHCFLLNEVIAEVVYVLNGVYKTPKSVIVKTLKDLIEIDSMVMYEAKTVYIQALDLYENRNLDFVDCCLCALKEKYEVKSFDKKLMKCVNGS